MSKDGKKAAQTLHRDLLERMAACPTADTLNAQVLEPFIAALERLCVERGYLLNTFGERTNLAVTSEDDAPVIYDLIEEYLDAEDS
ncbi:hypothetical protein JCM17960_33190 [Magnetospira thiophila]